MTKDKKHDAEIDEDAVKDKDNPEPEQDRTDSEPQETEDKDTETASEEPEEAAVSHHDSNAKHSWLNRCWHWLLGHKWISIPLAVLLLVGVLAAIPFTRFALAGLVLKQSFQVVVVDTETHKPVTSATIKLNGQEAETDSEGRATIRTEVGYAKLDVSKKYYQDTSSKVVVPIGKPKSTFQIELKADGRPVPVTLLNSISNKPAANVTIAAEGTEAKTDQDGKATIVLPADKKDVAITIAGEGFNATQATLTVTSDEIEANVFKVTPSGKIYFLSNASGKIDLIKSNLDGTERTTVLAGTGKEDKYNTVLLASRDWKYIALLSKRDGGEYSKLFLIETATDKVTTMDEGEATFNVYGWSGDRFVYSVNREKVKYWEAKRQALKSYHAPTKKITTLIETEAEGPPAVYAYQYILSVFILDKEVVYTLGWQWNGGDYYAKNKHGTINSIQADGSQKKVIKDYADQYLETRTAEFGEIYVLFEEGGTSKVDEYHNGKIETIDQKAQDFYNEEYPYYSVSPTGNKTLWSKYVDGKNTFFVGDRDGKNGSEIGRTEDYAVYGWFSDDYILVTKKNSEMHIMPASGIDGGIEKSPKITDYYKPNYYNNGFGYGYGG